MNDSSSIDQQNPSATEFQNDSGNNENRGESTIIPPPAPTKLRRRRRILDKLRHKRQQIIQQHRSSNSDNNNGENFNGNGSDSALAGSVSKMKQSLVAQYYCVDTVPSTPYIVQEQASSVAASTTNVTATGSNLTPISTIQPVANNNSLSTSQQQPKQQLLLPMQSRRDVGNGTGGTTIDIGSPTSSKVVNVVLPGVPSYEEDWARDTHDYFNLIVLVPVTVFNIMNWNWDILLSELSTTSTQSKATYTASSSNSILNMGNSMISYFDDLLYTVQMSWTGDWFYVFFYFTAAYFIFDLLWILILPICVKSPSVIIQHHIAVLIYILIPYLHPNVRYCMGACMTVEINTWFLIARRVFNKQGFPPWTLIELNSWLSIRVKVISIFFYVTWICIRCILYPALLFPFYQHWIQHSQRTGTYINTLLPSVPLHAAFCLLNLKWSYELLMSKLRYFRRQRLYYKHQRRLQKHHQSNSSSNGHHRQQYVYQPDPSISNGL